MKIFSFGVVLTTLFTSFVSLAGTLVINNNQSDPRAKEVMYAFIDAFDKAHPEVTVVIPGAKNKIQAELNVKASELSDISSTKESIKEIYSKYFKKDIHSNW